MRFHALTTKRVSIFALSRLPWQSTFPSRFQGRPKGADDISKHVFCAWSDAVRALFVICLFVTLALSVMAQTAGTGALTGTVTDSTGAVVPNATVTATSTDTGQTRTATTGSDGSYKFNLLPPGTYRVKFEAAGFQTVEVPSITVNVTETGVLNRGLTVGAQTQEVTVQAEVETIQTATSALGTVINSETVTELPLNTRNYTNLLAMSAGANTSVNNATTIGKGSTNIAVNGAGTSQNTYLEDGVPINNWFSLGGTTEGTIYGTFGIPNPDAIAEFKIQTSTYDAGYGRNPGSNVNVVTKSGTNDFHGTAFEFFRNTVLNANDFFYEYSELTSGQPNTQPVLNQNQFGGAFGGPVKKDKLFFFVNYQETQQKNGLASYSSSTVNLAPIPGGNRGTCPAGWTSLSQCDAAGQAFVPALAAAVCPVGRSAHDNAFDSTTLTGGINVFCAPTAASPLANINPVAISMLQLKLANGSYLIPGSGSAQYLTHTYSVPTVFKDHQGLGNFDYIINSKQTLSGRYIYETDPLAANFPAVNALEPGNALPGNPTSTTKTNHAALLKLTSLLSPNLVNEARISYQRYVTDDHLGSPFHDSQVGITDLQPGVDNLSYMSLSNLFSFGSHQFFGAYLPEDQFEWADQMSWTHEKHAIRFGFEAERIQSDQVYPSLAIGNPTFGSFGDFLIGRASCPAGTAPPQGTCTALNPGDSNGTPASSNISGVGGSTVANSQFPFEFRVLMLNGFVQDDFKVNSQLTLNLGVRWEYDGFPTEKYGNFSDFWPSVANTVPVPQGSVTNGVLTGGTLAGWVVPSNYSAALVSGLYKSNRQFPTQSSPPKDDFAPRVGFAWQPMAANAKWVMRGGAGYFYDMLSGSVTGNPLTHTGPAYGPPSAAPTATLADPWALPPGVISAGPGLYGFEPRWVNLTTGASSSLSALGIGPNITVPLVYEWNLNTQYEFLPRWVIELGYVGSHGVHLASTGNSTAADGSSGGATQFNVAQLVGPTCTICSTTGVKSNTPGNASLRTPLLGISPKATQLETIGTSKYNSLQATVRKQLSHGLQLQAAYTWSRAFNNAPFGVNTFPYIIQQYGPSTFYRPQRFVVNYVWNLPFGHPQGLEGKLVSGWTLSGVTTIQDGDPITITDSRGGTVFFGSPALSTAQFCQGMGPGNVATAGGLTQRVISGLTGGPGYLNGTAQGVFCSPPTVGAINGAGGGFGFGDAGSGILLGPGQDNWDMSLAKLTTVGGLREGATLEFRAEFFNTFNHPQFALPGGTTANGGGFGQITTSQVNPRVIQFALKYAF